MSNCWAEIRGGCSSTMSREHVISRAAMQDDLITVEGFKWVRGNSVTTSPNNLAARVLCKHHNSELSSLDAAAGELAKAMRMLPSSICDRKIVIDGWLFERWCLKVLLNLCASDWTEVSRPAPTPELVDIVFGTRRFPEGSGLYIVNRQVAKVKPLDHFRVNILLDTETRLQVLGLVLSFHHMLLVLSLRNTDPAPFLRALGLTPIYDFTDVQLRYRPRSISMTSPDLRAGLSVSIEWSQ